MIEKFLKELRDTADIQSKIFTQGSCFRLYKVLKVISPKAQAYWSDIDNHCITKIEGEFYDIGGIIKKSYIEENGYYRIPKKQFKGYSLLKWVSEEVNSIGAKIQKYK